MGYDVTMVVADGSGQGQLGNVSVIDVGQTSGRFKRMVITPWRVLFKAYKLKGDIYHAHDPELLPICLALKVLGKRVIFDAHEDVPKQILGKHYLRPDVRKTIACVYSWLERFVCKKLNGIIAATPTIREKFLPLNPNTQDINNYPLLGELEPLASSARQPNEICYIGSIAGIRGAREMIQALELTHPKVQLNLVGAFAEPNLENELAAYPGWAQVRSLGMQGRDGVREVLSRSQVGLVTLHPTPNYLDSLPIKMFEYMSAGIPVIASNFPLWERILRDCDCGLSVNPLDPQQIATAIEALVMNPQRASEMGTNGQTAVRERYNWAIEEQKLKMFYQRLLTPKQT